MKKMRLLFLLVVAFACGAVTGGWYTRHAFVQDIMTASGALDFMMVPDELAYVRLPTGLTMPYGDWYKHHMLAQLSVKNPWFFAYEKRGKAWLENMAKQGDLQAVRTLASLATIHGDDVTQLTLARQALAWGDWSLLGSYILSPKTDKTMLIDTDATGLMAYKDVLPVPLALAAFYDVRGQKDEAEKWRQYGRNELQQIVHIDMTPHVLMLGNMKHRDARVHISDRQEVPVF